MSARAGRWAWILLGAVAGLGWASALRWWMAALVGPSSRIDAAGTIVGVLLPGLLVGAAIGLAVSGKRHPLPRWMLRAAVAAPVAFAVFPLLRPGALAGLVGSGLGGGAIGVALVALGGGYALGGRRTWARLLCGVPAALLIAGLVIAPALAEPRLALTTGAGVLEASTVGSLLVVLCVAAAMPYRILGDGTDEPATGTVQPLRSSVVHTESGRQLPARD